ncbi:hypothetical protein MMC17_008245 [Xylographa soralifera]|nr:hypothetical protein [Xylographa soralifera]
MAPKSSPDHERDGRQYLVEEILPKLESSNNSLYKTIVRGLFEINDRNPQSAILAPLIYKLYPKTKAAEQGLSNNLGKWTIAATYVLFNLKDDIRLILETAPTRSDWDNDVLKEFVELIGFLRERFLSKETLVRLVKAYLASSLTASGDKLDNTLTRWIRRLHGKDKTFQKELEQWLKKEDDISISTTTPRELRIRNKVYQWKSSKETPMERMLKSFKELKVAQEKASSSCEKTNKPAWRSRTIVVAKETRTGIFLTGGTKFTCHEVNLFSESSAQTRAINCLSSPVNFKEIEEAHYEIVDMKKKNDELPTSGDSQILSWACSGHDFKGKAPCFRCQRMYSTWVMNLTPSSVNDKRNDLEHWQGHQPSTGYDNELVYCAESVVAAKIQLLRKGKLSLV